MVFRKFIERIDDVVEEVKKRIDDTLDDVRKIYPVKDRLDSVRDNLLESLVNSIENALGFDLRSKKDLYLQDFDKILNYLGLETPYPTFETFKEKGDNYLRIILDLPGFKKENVDLECAPKKLRVQGKTIITEKSERKINKIINLPEIVNPQTARATLEDGILIMELKIVK
ncbi:MAG: Hsp20/alpha crystallin family protein [Candidatus Lokiarchaeota archaeon]|nr:Hsp20/alpha crystallin family protein [Candidatus Lokiarchaeota archaeon]